MYLQVPGLKQAFGLGDAAKAATSAVGIQPCGGCQKRAETLNQALQFVPMLPPGFGVVQACGANVLGSRQQDGAWAVFRVVNGRMSGHLFCGTCGNPEGSARAEFAALCG
jgi:hypothetical protein